jgi:hypothetical protein
VANYNVDIDVALKGSEALKQLTNELRSVSKEVGKVNAATIKAGKASDEGFSRKRIQNVDNYSKAISKAERTLRRAAMGTDAERAAVRALVGAQKEYNQELERQNRLIREEERAQRVSKIISASDRISARSDISSPVMGARHIEGSPMARDFGFEPKASGKGSAASAAAKITASKRVGAAVSAGAFPLLFGGGPSMALGGALGGAVSGSTFGPASIALQVLGGAVDTYVAQLTSLANSLDSTQGILSGLEAAGYKVSDSTKSVINSYEDAGLFADAYGVALEEINRVLGPDGAAKLAAYKEETDKLQAEFEKVSGSLKGELLPVLTGLIRVILGTKSAFDQLANSPLGKILLQGVKKSAFNLFPALGITEKTLQALAAAGAPTGEPGIPESVRIATKNAAAEKLARDTAAGEAGLIVDAQLKAVQAGNNLLDDKVVTTRKNIIQEEYLAKLRKEGITDGERDLAEKEKNLALGRLNRQIQAAGTREQERQTRELERQDKVTERLNKKKERAIERAVKGADRELERADTAFNRANDQLDKIIQKNEDKMAFEREYAELIKNGSTPAAAKQAVELKKQQLELDRNFEKLEEQLALQLEIAKAAILTAEARGASGTELDALNKDLADLLNKIDGLPGKKEDAEGAITAALAPKSERQELLDYLTTLQGQINDMMSPVQRIIGLSETLNGAFSESFKGIVSGSMTAREALANLFQRTADHFLDMAAQMIAAQIRMQSVKLFMSFFSPLSGGGAPASKLGSATDLTGLTGNFNLGTGPTFGNPEDFLPGGRMGRRALGGPVSRNQPYLVGERGPEMFVPGAQGNIVPSNAMGGGANVTVNVDASGSSVEGDGNQAAQLGKAIGIAVQQELIKQKRPGGLLTS